MMKPSRDSPVETNVLGFWTLCAAAASELTTASPVGTDLASAATIALPESAPKAPASGRITVDLRFMNQPSLSVGNHLRVNALVVYRWFSRSSRVGDSKWRSLSCKQRHCDRIIPGGSHLPFAIERKIKVLRQQIP